MNITEAEALVRALNNAAYEQTEGATTIRPFGLISDGENIAITFFEDVMWANVEDTFDENLRSDIECHLESVARLDVPKLIELLPPEVSDQPS